MQEVSVPLVPVSILRDCLSNFDLIVEIVRLLVSTIVRLCHLESVKNSSVVINNFGQIFYSVSSIK